jgi:hypothetical protein
VPSKPRQKYHRQDTIGNLEQFNAESRASGDTYNPRRVRTRGSSLSLSVQFNDEGRESQSLGSPGLGRSPTARSPFGASTRGAAFPGNKKVGVGEGSGSDTPPARVRSFIGHYADSPFANPSSSKAVNSHTNPSAPLSSLRRTASHTSSTSSGTPPVLSPQESRGSGSPAWSESQSRGRSREQRSPLAVRRIPFGGGGRPGEGGQLRGGHGQPAEERGRGAETRGQQRETREREQQRESESYERQQREESTRERPKKVKPRRLSSEVSTNDNLPKNHNIQWPQIT